MYPKQLSQNARMYQKLDPKYEVDKDDYAMPEIVETNKAIEKVEYKIAKDKKENRPTLSKGKLVTNDTVKDSVPYNRSSEYKANRIRANIAYLEKKVSYYQSKMEKEYKRLGKLLY